MLSPAQRGVLLLARATAWAAQQMGSGSSIVGYCPKCTSFGLELIGVLLVGRSEIMGAIAAPCGLRRDARPRKPHEAKPTV